MRIIFILLLIVVAIGLLRMLVGDVVKAVNRSLKSDGKKRAETPGPSDDASARRFVRDAESGSYIDEESALRVTIDGEDLFFESEKTRDAYLNKRG